MELLKQTICSLFLREVFEKVINFRKHFARLFAFFGLKSAASLIFEIVCFLNLDFIEFDFFFGGFFFNCEKKNMKIRKLVNLL
jgi:hypothetical protein